MLKDNSTYHKLEFSTIGEIFSEKFNCSSPILPKQYRGGLEICKNVTFGKMTNNFFKYKTGLFSTNVWSTDYYLPPPCEYYLLQLTDTVKKPE